MVSPCCQGYIDLEKFPFWRHAHTLQQCSYQTAALPHFFGKCHTFISPRGPKGAKKEKKNLLQNVHKHYMHTYIHFLNISQNFIVYSIVSLTKSCKMLI